MSDAVKDPFASERVSRLQSAGKALAICTGCSGTVPADWPESSSNLHSEVPSYFVDWIALRLRPPLAGLEFAILVLKFTPVPHARCRGGTARYAVY